MNDHRATSIPSGTPVAGGLRTVADARNRLVDRTSGSSIKWLCMACLYIAAGAAVLVSVALGVDSEANAAAITILGGIALVWGLVALPLASRIPQRWTGPALSCSLVLVSLTVVAAGEPDTPYALFYVWVGVAGWFFLRERAALALTASGVALSALVMFVVVPDAENDAGPWWIMVVVSLLAMSALGAVLHARAAVLIEELRHAATRDPLTRLLNRRGYQERLTVELARARRYTTPLSIVLADLDCFKELNDRFGHREGDRALEAFAEICDSALRAEDFVSRVGGEEFAIVLPDTSGSGAIVVAERLREAVAARLRGPDGAPVTASFGVATFPEHGTDAEILLDHADQAMYEAKALGRDRVAAFCEDLAGRPTAQSAQPSLDAVLLLAEALDLRDTATRAHSETVAALASGTAVRLGLDDARVERVRLAALLHDVGKIGVPDDVLRKPGKLTDGEWDAMRKHPELGARIVDSAGLHDVAKWVLAHHERPDGRGYPRGLRGDDIPVEAQILAVADAYEAMTAHRPYRAALPAEVAMEELRRCTGTQFAPLIVEAFLDHVGAGANVLVAA